MNTIIKNPSFQIGSPGFFAAQDYVKMKIALPFSALVENFLPP